MIANKSGMLILGAAGLMILSATGCDRNQTKLS